MADGSWSHQPSAILPSYIALCRHSPTAHLVGAGRQIMNAGGVDPRVVELEERADGDRVVDGFLAPPGRGEPVDVLTSNAVRLLVHLLDEREERLFPIVDRCGS